MDFDPLSITSQRDLAKNREISASDLAEACYQQIERLNPILNAFITVIPPRTEELPNSGSMPLYGIPVAVKDLYDTKGVRTTGGSKFFAERVPDEDAFVVQKIKKAGAQIVGKTNTHEIALGVTNNNPHFGACKNPWDLTRTPGGSSGGSAVAVATGMARAALGTDTGGSIRIPAALCGVVGLKPTYGRVSLRGIIPLSWNLDHAGPITRKVEDAALMLQVMGGYDELDPTSVKTLPGDYSSHLKDSMKERRVALAVGRYIEDGADPEILQAVFQAAKVLEEQGVILGEVNTDFLREAAQANAVMTQADAAAFHRERLKEHPDWFGADVRQRLEAGAGFTSSEYALARRTQTEVKRRCELLLEEYDMLLLPTVPIPAPVLEGEDAIERARQLTRFTAPFNLTGLPALSVPCGFTKEGLPIGLQIVSRAWNESGVLRAGFAYQQATEWHKIKPHIVQEAG
ncbi:MAG: Asp-tRNA(Asn)/Glu-tRNA(Gln) amidotransferase subunit GatA [Chloroflexi bacterium]|nr:Asp-tRNA(Asn)/Glu-tRNA(Gln) amidotransferase subunit GatA [Chloroflexota bacterium]MDL1943110.1 Asp-tRNA(Asn)/Glu-tRNA(Gln) amidotransferase subunit GatA [Chloroflexi bacterium CFX2]